MSRAASTDEMMTNSALAPDSDEDDDDDDDDDELGRSSACVGTDAEELTVVGLGRSGGPPAVPPTAPKRGGGAGPLAAPEGGGGAGTLLAPDEGGGPPGAGGGTAAADPLGPIPVLERGDVEDADEEESFPGD